MENMKIKIIKIMKIIIATIDSIGGGCSSSRNVTSLPQVPTLTMSLYCNQKV
jgi:hypothetical protein